MWSLLLTCQRVRLNMEAVVAGDFKTEMWHVLLQSSAGTASLLVTTLFLLEHRQQRRIFHVVIQLAVVMATNIGCCT